MQRFKYLISFDNNNWQDISSYVNYRNTSLKRAFLSANYKSSTNTLKFELVCKPRRNLNAHADLVLTLIGSMVASENVYVEFYYNEEIQFKGTLDKRGLSQAISSIPESVSLVAYDFTYYLDKNIENTFEYPSDFTKDEDGWYLFKCNPLDTEQDLIVDLITKSGFSVSDIDFENSSPVMRYDEPTQYRMIRHIYYDSDNETTYRELIDTLLHENAKVLTTTNEGRFVIVDLTTLVKTGETIEDVSDKYFTKSDSFGIKLSTRGYDGVKLTWSDLSTMEQALIYDAGIGEISDDGTTFTNGVEILPENYYPETSDIEEVWFEYTSDWLDREYYTAESRLKNEDLSLLSAKNVFAEVYKDEEVQMVDGFPINLALKSMFSYQNTSTTESKYINRLALYGDCLYRKKINDYTYPTDCSDAEEYESKYIFKEENAKEYCFTYAKLKNFGIMQYTWKQREFIKEGKVKHIAPRNTKISSDVVITSVTLTYQGNVVIYNVTAQGYGEYASLEIRRRAKANGANTGTAGKDGENAVIEYAKNTSLEIPPPSDTLYLYNDRYLFYGEAQLGIAYWSRTAPLSTELADNEYIWQRNSV